MPGVIEDFMVVYHKMLAVHTTGSLASGHTSLGSAYSDVISYNKRFLMQHCSQVVLVFFS